MNSAKKIPVLRFLRRPSLTFKSIFRNACLNQSKSFLNSRSITLVQRNAFQFSSSTDPPLKFGSHIPSESSSEGFLRAQCYFRQDNFEKTLVKLQEISAATSSNIEQLKLLGKTYIALSKFEEALEIFDKVIELSPGDIEANVVSMGIIEKSQQDSDSYLEAITDRITKYHEEESGQKIAIAMGSMFEEEYPVIIELLNNPTVYEDEDLRFLAYALLKEAYTRIGQTEKAIEILEESLMHLSKNREDIYFLLAKLYSETGNSQEEKNCLMEAYALNPNQFDVVTELAWIAFKEGEKEKSNGLLESAKSIEPGYSKIYFYEAKMKQQEKNLEAAEALLMKCLEIDGIALSSGHVHNQLGVLELQRGRIKAAVASFYKALEINNEEPTFYYNLALAFKILKENTKAVEYYEKGLMLQPNNVDIILDLAKLQTSMRRYSEAVDTLKQAAEVSPKSLSIKLELSRAFNTLGDTNNAIKTIKEALVLDPDHEEANNFYKQIQRKDD